MQQKIQVLSPANCTEEQIKSFKELLLSGEQIHIEEHILDKNIANAKALAFYYNDDQQVVGIGAVKNPQKSYRRKVFENADVEEVQDLCRFELGYFVTKQGYGGRGICSILLQHLMEETSESYRSFFATTKSEAMKKVFTNFGFNKLGQEWQTDSGNTLQLYIYHNNL